MNTGVQLIEGEWCEWEAPAGNLMLLDGRIVKVRPGDLVLVDRDEDGIDFLWHERGTLH